MNEKDKKRADIMAAARFIKLTLEGEAITVDTIIITKDKITLAQGTPCEGDYRELEDFAIDDKAVAAVVNDDEKEADEKAKTHVVKVKVLGIKKIR